LNLLIPSYYSQIIVSTEVHVLADPLLAAFLFGEDNRKLQLVANDSGAGNVRAKNVIGPHEPADPQQPTQLPG